LLKTPFILILIRLTEKFQKIHGEVHLCQVREKVILSKAAQKCPDSRRPKSCGASRTRMYVAATKDEGNDEDERFSAAC
jgi:hypothetical protein